MKKLFLITAIVGLELGFGITFTRLAAAEQKVINLTSNGSFEGVTGGRPNGWNWNVSGGAQAVCAVDTSLAMFGRNSLKITNATVDTGNIFGRLGQEAKVSPRTTYTLSCWVKGVKVTGIYWTNWEGWSLAVPDGTYDWKRIQTTFTTKENQTATVLGLNTANITEALYLDGVQLEESSQAHDFEEEQKPFALKIRLNSKNDNNIFTPGEPVFIELEISGARRSSDAK